MSTISKIGVSFVASTTSFTEGLLGMRKSAVKFSKGLKSDFSAAGKDIGAIGKAFGTGLAVAVVGIAAGIAKSTAEISEMVDEAQKIGITTSLLQALGYAAKTTGSDAETLKRSFTELQKSTTDALDGNQKTIGSFNQLGISMADLKKLNPEQRFRLVVDALSKVTDTNTKARIGFDLLGKTFTELTPMISGGAKGLRAAAIEAASIGQVLSEADNSAIKEMGENWEWVGNLITGAFNTLAAVAAPIVNDLVGKFREWITGGTNFRDVLMTLINIFGTVALVVAQIVDGVRIFIKLGSAGFSALGGIVFGLFEFILKGVRLFTDQFLSSINEIIGAWNALPFGKKVEPIKFTMLDDFITELENLRGGSFQAMSEFGSEAGDIWSKGFSAEVGSVIDKIQTKLIATNSDAIDQVKKINKGGPIAAESSTNVGAKDIKGMSLAPTDSYAKIGLMTSAAALPEQKKQSEYLKAIDSTLKLINQAVRGTSNAGSAAYAN